MCESVEPTRAIPIQSPDVDGTSATLIVTVLPAAALVVAGDTYLTGATGGGLEDGLDWTVTGALVASRFDGSLAPFAYNRTSYCPGAVGMVNVRVAPVRAVEGGVCAPFK
jgi:hypothetical protein